MKNNFFNQTARFRPVGGGKRGGEGAGRSQPRASCKRRARACALALHNAWIER